MGACMKIMKFFLTLSVIPLFLLTANCGAEDEDGTGFGDSSHVKVRILPTAPIVINAPRNITIFTNDGGTLWDIDAPNVQFRLEVDNKKGDRPITILLAHMLATGPKGEKHVWINPHKITTVVNGSDGPLETYYPRGFIVEVPPGRKSTCMHKVDYLELPSVSDSCPSDLEESDDMTSCCPTAQYSTANNWIYAEKIQDMSDEELVDPNNVFISYNFEMTLIGWFGTSMMPESNLRKKFYFFSSPL